MILGLNKLGGRPRGMAFENLDGLAIERLVSIREIERALGCGHEVAVVNMISVLGGKAPQELQPLKVGLIGIEGCFKEKNLSVPERA